MPRDDDYGDGLFTDEERKIIERVTRSRMWRLLRDSLCLRREQLFNGTPTQDNDRAIWLREGALQEVQRLLRTGPHLAVYYERYLREQTEKGEPPVLTEPVPGEDPEV